MRQPSTSIAEETSSHKPTVDLDFSRILNGDKRKNPFSKYETSLSILLPFKVKLKQ